ncbi:MAG: hypothetical protein HQL32_15315 [Planctomycetes bacterium]|nr:hypothetical protein [Planctomycetota bacterium]
MLDCKAHPDKALAVSLACNPKELQAIRQKIEKNRLTTPLFDGEQGTQELEASFEQMWKTYLEKRATQPKVY